VNVRYSFMSTDDLYHILQTEFTDLILLHHTDNQWCLHTDYADRGFRGATPRDCCLEALRHFLAVRESARYN
jgi:hypothetical protein